jgi:hypothetical protein
MDKATQIAMKQNKRLSNKDTKGAIQKNKAEPLSYTDLQKLLDNANLKKALDKQKRFSEELINELSKRVTAIEDELKNTKKEKSK